MELCNSGSWEVIMWYGRCGGCGQEILGCKYIIANWKYVTVGDGSLKFDMADGVWSGDTEM